jgi:site-specific DNA-cytosine methylase
MLTIGSLFSGIGGFDLGLERAGMRVVWQCEQDPFCRRILAKHWPGVPCHPDVRALVADTARDGSDQCPPPGAFGQRTGAGDQPGGVGGEVPVPVPYVGGGGVHTPGCWLCEWAEEHYAERGAGLDEWITEFRAGHVCQPEPRERPPADLRPVIVPRVDVLCGGFPCQDLSVAGRQAGIDGRRSGLWGEYVRLVDVLRPRYVIVENVRNLLAGDRGRWFGRVLGDLAACGYDAEWDCIPASAVGAPHRRDRVWLVAYPQRDELRQQPGRRGGPGGAGAPELADDGREESVADPQRPRLEGHGAVPGQPEVAEPRDGRALADAAGQGRGSARAIGSAEAGAAGPLGEPSRSGWWESEPDVGRVAHGIPGGLEPGGGAHARCLQEAGAEGASDDDLLRAVRKHMALAEASQGHPTCGICGNPLPDVPYRGGLPGGDAEAAGAEDMRSLRGDLHGVQPFAREVLLAGVPVRAWTTEREEALGWWDREPEIPRVAHGVPQRVDRLRALGNSLVPQIAQWLGERIVAYEQAQEARVEAAEEVA